ncbi:twitching motility protein PilT [Serinicoccus sp. CUA-874]|uniref:type II toxin-antitoxin system VapC family toxin n=1 Tax=Serinicoccus sp. CUA-874 TaxID=1517939 RepID=UPI0009672A66|nr:type II toxin-antitoxin system VapC family toxin [Serinicoccus sp. CUA-874]OLT17992.1 twitching motility protein PilT [Serinicoccus sp. CUA-874]
MTAQTSDARGVLDTSVVIGEVLKPIPGVLAISAVTLAELHFGVLVAKSAEVRAERLRRLSILQHRFDPLPVDEAVAASYGRLAAAVVEAGRQPRRRTMDLLIAATAHAHDATLYTRNPDDFGGLEDLVDVRAV